MTDHGTDPSNPSFIQSLKLDDGSFEKLQGWRLSYFPPALNYIPAHLTLLHTASSDQVSRLREHWPSFESLAPPELKFTAPRYLGRGVAIVIESPSHRVVRASIIEVMAGDLIRQDQQPFRAHVTVQNKVDPGEANALFESLRSGFEPWQGMGESVLIWKYLGGPWALESELRFNDPIAMAGKRRR